MEMKPMVSAPIVTPAPVPMPMPMPAPAPAPMPHHDGHVHLHASYKHTQIVLPEVKPVHHMPVAAAPVVAPFNPAYVLVLFILLVIITRSFFLNC